MDIQELQDKLQKAEATVAELTKKLEATEQKLSEAEASNNSVAELQEKLNAYETEIEGLKQLNSDLTAKLESKDKPEHLEKLIRERDEAKQKYRELNEQFNSYKSKADEWESYKKTKKEKLLEGLDDKFKSIAEKLDLNDVEAFIETVKTENKPAPPDSRMTSQAGNWVTDYSKPDVMN